MVFKDIDVKKGFAMNETVIQLPKQTMTTPASCMCYGFTGDMGLKAKEMQKPIK